MRKTIREQVLFLKTKIIKRILKGLRKTPAANTFEFQNVLLEKWREKSIVETAFGIYLER